MHDPLIAGLTGTTIGILFKEAIRRSLISTRAKRQAFEVSEKPGYGSRMIDVLTSADKEAQRICVRLISQCMPGVHICAEEEPLNDPVPAATRTFVTLDPLDGTRAFIRRQSHGIASMLSLTHDEAIVSAFVGDVNTHEIYGYRPGSVKVHRIPMHERGEELVVEPTKLWDGFILLRQPLEKHSQSAQDVIRCFRGHEIEGGSIGTWMARLWKREVNAVMIPPGTDTPWDTNPIYGISKHLGFTFWKKTSVKDYNGMIWVEYDPPIVRTVTEREHEVLIKHPLDT